MKKYRLLYSTKNFTESTASVFYSQLLHIFFSDLNKLVEAERSRNSSNDNSLCSGHNQETAAERNGYSAGGAHLQSLVNRCFVLSFLIFVINQSKLQVRLTLL